MKNEKSTLSSIVNIEVKIMIPENYLEKVYAGFLGMNVGIRLGAPLEPVEWTYERIQQVYGDINGYVKDYNTFSADDDVNGPVLFIRALYDDAKDRELTPQDVGRAWLNYSRDGIGMFWWGGEGISTEHTAYLNLKKGIPAPKSGSAEVNGIVLAEQIGGQIFIDTWGLLFPNNYKKAADYAEKAASVSHDKNGLYGARFIAACISKAFSAETIEEVISAGLECIPKDCTYAKVVNSVVDFYKQHPDDFRKCRQYLEEEWGYDKYPGVCHIIPNAGVCVLALIYGQGNFSRTVEIAAMCGWDTDCNAGNVGTIVGVFQGLQGIPNHYRNPINDTIITSSISGYLNILDIPSFCKELVLLGYQLAGEKPPKLILEGVRHGEVYFDFILPGSTHGFKTSNSFKTILRHNNEVGFVKKGSLEILFDRMVDGDQSKIYYQTFYRREQFNDEKYKPTFAPKAYSGQTVSAKIYLNKWQGEEIYLIPYVRNTFNKEEMTLSPIILKEQKWNDLVFTIPDTNGAMIDEVGFIIKSPSPLSNRALGQLYLDEFRIYGNSKYSIDFRKQAVEFLSITPFSHNRGKWSLFNDRMKCITTENCASLTGNYYSKNFILESKIRPISGFRHGLIFRALGAERHYYVGFDGTGSVSLLKKDFGYSKLQTTTFDWELGKTYSFKVTCVDNEMTFYINDLEVLHTKDIQYEYGMVGLSSLEKGECDIYSFQVKEIN
jgi:ADP-ribosylglycohydrolase